ncbi:MAG: protein kinase [Pseudomonadota bacterium]
MNMPLVDAKTAPARGLVGMSLPNGWQVVERIPGREDPGFEHVTGGHFSVGYIVEKDGRKAFAKAFNIANALQRQNAMNAILTISTEYLYEKELLDFCRNKKLGRVVQAIDTGELSIPWAEYNNFPTPVPYLIFELADEDIRRAIGRAGKLEDAAKLRYLHEVAVGLTQLHNNHVAHQDLKPSNVLLFDSLGQGAKIADLGRASRRGAAAAHDGYLIAGDSTYAPPEQLYGVSAPDWVDRRLACDAFHLGGLVAFLFCGIAPLAGLKAHLPEEYWPGRWQGSYEDVLPQLIHAFSRFLESLVAEFPPWARDELRKIVSELCNPDYAKRGDPKARQMHGRPIGVDRFVSRFDRLAKRAMVEARKP